MRKRSRSCFTKCDTFAAELGWFAAAGFTDRYCDAVVGSHEVSGHRSQRCDHRTLSGFGITRHKTRSWRDGWTTRMAQNEQGDQIETVFETIQHLIEHAEDEHRRRIGFPTSAPVTSRAPDTRCHRIVRQRAKDLERLSRRTMENVVPILLVLLEASYLVDRSSIRPETRPYRTFTQGARQHPGRSGRPPPRSANDILKIRGTPTTWSESGKVRSEAEALIGQNASANGLE